MPGRGKPLERTGAAPSTAQHGPAPTRPTGGSSTVSFRPMTGRRGGPRPPAPRHCSGGRWAEQVPRCELGTPCRRAMPAVPSRGGAPRLSIRPSPHLSEPLHTGPGGAGERVWMWARCPTASCLPRPHKERWAPGPRLGPLPVRRPSPSRTLLALSKSPAGSPLLPPNTCFVFSSVLSACTP